ncbi:hypothetical protein Salmuc_02914 [Salipiger mucosus DSM 16094]|uniref:Uncharacterized protein n=1 Tax=Salipiger mucosus DSM 16094 TaxID=1123237 RepID=S9Q8R6_9RHOB|nr:hypothetical protein Salmuc_02914 [Salipiger mucosus DSM 16094]
MLERLGAREVVVVTDGYHAPRARLVARRLGLVARSSSPRARLSRRRLRAALREVPAYVWYGLSVRP